MQKIIMETVYKPNKKNILITLVGSSIFIILGIFFIIKPDYFASSYFSKSLGMLGKPISIQIFGFLGTMLFFLLSIGVLNIFFSNYALLITEKGFINNTSLTNAGLIHWKDVKHVKLNKGLIYIYVKNEKNYFSKIKNPLIKLNALIYNKTYKVSFVIDLKRLTVSEDELFEIFKKHAKL